MKKKLLCTALAAVMVLGLCACGGDEQPAGDNNGESTATGAAFKLGGTGPLTGSAAIYGVAAKKRRPNCSGRDQRAGRRHPV